MAAREAQTYGSWGKITVKVARVVMMRWLGPAARSVTRAEKAQPGAAGLVGSVPGRRR